MTQSRRSVLVAALFSFVLVGCVDRKAMDSDGESASSDVSVSSSDDSTPTAGTTTGVDTTTGDVAGTVTTDPVTTADPTDPVATNDLYLLAFSTVVDPGRPLQAIATHTVTSDGGLVTMRIELQLLSLGIGSVTMPRQPVGQPLVYEDVVVQDGAFILDMGVIVVPGAANPITGSDLTASLVLDANFGDADFYCGALDGEVTVPLQLSLLGSTFAAVRIADPQDLPAAVTINCQGSTVTENF